MPKEPFKMKNIPSATFIMVGMIALAMAWAIISMAGCIMEERKECYKNFSVNIKTIREANKNESTNR